MFCSVTEGAASKEVTLNRQVTQAAEGTWRRTRFLGTRETVPFEVRDKEAREEQELLLLFCLFGVLGPVFQKTDNNNSFSCQVICVRHCDCVCSVLFVPSFCPRGNKQRGRVSLPVSCSVTRAGSAPLGGGSLR